MSITSRDLISGATGIAVGGILTWFLKSKIKRVYQTFSFVAKNFPPEPLKMVIVARSDLTMTSGKLAAQCAHAAVSCYAGTKEYNPTLLATWESTGQAKVVVRTQKPGDSELYKMAEEAKQLNIVSAIIRDAGRTQVKSGTPTALGLGPAKVSDLDKISGHLRLY